MTRMEHVTDIHVLRDPQSLFSIIYDPKQIDPKNSRSYQECIKKIGEAWGRKVIDQEGRKRLEEEITWCWMRYEEFRRVSLGRDDLP